jgi:hypothetical protein
MRRLALLSTGWRDMRVRNRWREFARLCVKSVPNLSPLTYSILCLSGNGGTAHAGYSLLNVLYRKTKSVKRLRTVVVGFAKDGKVVCRNQHGPFQEFPGDKREL